MNTSTRGDMTAEILSHYRIEEKIGEGGMGVVYRAVDVLLNRPVALKVIHARLVDVPGVRDRVLREARLVAALNHPNVCTIYEVFSLDRDTSIAPAGAPVIALELMEGRTLRDHLAHTGPLQPKQLLEIVIQIAEGLAEAHRAYIVHRDLKPQNVLMTAGRVKILDFGLARAVAEPASITDVSTRADDPITGQGVVMGTTVYMSPEQASGLAVDHRSDIFSFGILMYELAAGVRPFTGNTSAKVMAKIIEGQPPSLLEARPDLPLDIDRIIRRCLQKSADDRYNDTRDLCGDLREARDALRLQTDPRVRDPRSGSAAQMPAGRRLWSKIAAVVLGVAVLALLIVVALQRAHTSPPARQAVHTQVTFIGDASYPAVSPDGNFIAYVRGEPWEETNALLRPLVRQKVVIQDLAGGGRPVELVECAARCGGLVWSPDSASLLVADAGLKVIPRFGGDPRSIIGGGVSSFAWSPSGSEIAYARTAPEIRFISLATNQSRTVPVRWSGMAHALDWSPSGQRLAAVVAGKGDDTALWLVSPDGSQQEQIVDETSTMSVVRWAPDGTSLYVLKQAEGANEVWSLPLSFQTGKTAGPAVRALADVQAGRTFTIARDGRIAYTRQLHYANLWSAPLAPRERAGAAVQLTAGTSRNQFPAVSPDGTRLAFVRGEGAQSNVFVMPMTGGSPHQLTFSGTVTGAPAWSPDGSALAFCASFDGIRRVAVTGTAGGAVKPFPNSQCTMRFSEVPVMWAPRAEIVYQRTGNRNYHVLDPGSGAERPLVDDESVGWLFGPRSSPDGSTVAAFWNRRGGSGVWMFPWRSPGNARLALEAFAWPLHWSADGQTLIVYRHAPASEVLAFPTRGGAPKLLRPLAGQRVALVPAVTPDGRVVVYSAHAIHSDVWLADGIASGVLKR
jgi:Tol biopolymer transport system component